MTISNKFVKQVVLFLLGFIFCYKVSAQITIKPLPKSSSIASSNARVVRQSAITDTVTLPFWDDFSYSGQDPDTAFWLHGKDVLINSGAGINPPTINVATFDGLNSEGRPHSDSEFVSPADSLVSRSIDLSLVAEAKKSTVFLSFFWQMQGLGELPDEKDSIRLQFFRADTTWVTKWKVSGLESNLSDEFSKVYISLNEESYFHKGFKFRFQSFGKTSGPFDAWHLDYIYLNQDRTSTDESIFDRSIATEPVSIFKTYTNIPYDQLFAFPDTIYAPYSITVSTQENNPQPVQYIYNIVDTISNSVIYTESDNFALLALERKVVNTSVIDNTIFNQATDSLVLNTEFQFLTGDKFIHKSIDGLDTTFLVSDSLNYRVNDTVRRTYVIHETLSYDDGTADFAAGINQVNGQLAVEYTIATEDTLTAVDIYFPVIDPRASGQAISFSVFKDLSGESGSVLIRQDELVQYSSKINEFVRYSLNRPILVSGTFYIVFEQVRADFIAIGLDKNNPQPERIFSNTFGEWEQNSAISVNGSLMFRAIFENSNAVITSVRNQNALEPITVFPNPAKDKIHIQGDYQSLELFTISGDKINIDYESGELNVLGLNNGIYILKVKSRAEVISKKIIVSH